MAEWMLAKYIVEGDEWMWHTIGVLHVLHVDHSEDFIYAYVQDELGDRWRKGMHHGDRVLVLNSPRRVEGDSVQRLRELAHA